MLIIILLIIYKIQMYNKYKICILINNLFILRLFNRLNSNNNFFRLKYQIILPKNYFLSKIYNKIFIIIILLYNNLIKMQLIHLLIILYKILIKILCKIKA